MVSLPEAVPVEGNFVKARAYHPTPAEDQEGPAHGRTVAGARPSGAVNRDRPRLPDAAEIVLEANDVVFAEVFAVLHLDEHELGRAGVLDAM